MNKKEEDKVNIDNINKDILFVFCDELKDVVKISDCKNCPSYNKCKLK